MKYHILAAAAIMLGGVANADPAVLKPGEWQVSFDTVVTGTVFGEEVPGERESSFESECWEDASDLTLSPVYFESDECTLTNTTNTSFGFKSDVSCLFDFFILQGTLVAEANATQDAFAGRMELKSTDEGMDLVSETLFLGYHKGQCPEGDASNNNNN